MAGSVHLPVACDSPASAAPSAWHRIVVDLADRIDLQLDAYRFTAPWMRIRRLHNANNRALRMVSGLIPFYDPPMLNPPTAA